MGRMTSHIPYISQWEGLTIPSGNKMLWKSNVPLGDDLDRNGLSVAILVEGVIHTVPSNTKNRTVGIPTSVNLVINH